MPLLVPHPLRTRSVWLAAFLPWLWVGCAQPMFPPPVLTVEMQDAGAAARVDGDPELRVILYLNRPWSGEQALFPGLLGLRCSTIVAEADQQLGAGRQSAWELAAGPLLHVVPFATLRAWPGPMVLQALAARTFADGTVGLALSNAYVVERRGDTVEVRPYSAWWGLGRHPTGLLWLLLGPVLVVVAVRRVRRPLPRALWPIALAAALGAALWTRVTLSNTASVAAGDQPPPLWVAPERADTLTILDRHHGPGVRRLVEAIAAVRRDGEPLTIVLSPERVTGHESLVLQLTHLLHGVEVVRTPEAAAPGLVLRVLADPEVVNRAAAEVRAMLGKVPPQAEPEVHGEELARSEIGVLLRVERPR